MGLLQRDDAARRWFAFLAPGYDALVSSTFWPEQLQHEGIDRLEVGPTDCVLDVGCGTGETVGHLLPRGATVHGLDQSAPQLDTARDKADLDDARFVRGDAGALPYADETFDCVASVGSILYWEDPADALREAYRVTNPGGRILVLGFNRRFASWDPVRNAQDALNSTLFFRYGPDEATGLFRDAGWRDVENEITGPAWSPRLVIATTARKPA